MSGPPQGILGSSAPADSATSAPADASDVEFAAAKRSLELAKVKAEHRALAAPWWQSAGAVTVISAILAMTVPGTAAVLQSFANKRDIEFALIKQQEDSARDRIKEAHDTELAHLRLESDVNAHYLQLASDEKQQKLVLRFVQGTSTDAKLTVWATAELEILRQRQLVEEQLAAALQAMAPSKQDNTGLSKLEKPKRIIIAQSSRIRRLESGIVETDPAKLRIRATLKSFKS